MEYEGIIKGRFIKRINRFVAICEINGAEIHCHVKNTGRCSEILVEGSECYLEEVFNTARKYRYSLVAVRKGERLINIDSQASNKAAAEFLASGKLFDDITNLRAEKAFGKSRFDFYFEHNGKKSFLEVKGVTLEREGAVYFPDAPTVRGTKHLNELCECVKEGYDAYVMFVVQMKGATHFSPNNETDPGFSNALRSAEQKGVNVLCYDCSVTEKGMNIEDEVPVML